MVQVLERKGQFRLSAYSCEVYGGRDTLRCEIVELIE